MRWLALLACGSGWARYRPKLVVTLAPRHGAVTRKIGRVARDGAAGAVRVVVDMVLGSTFSLLL